MDWGMVGAIATVLSACATFIAAAVALKALEGWKAQEKSKALQNYKMSIETLRIVRPMLHQSFSALDSGSIHIYDQDRPISVDLISKCAAAWASYSVYYPSELEVEAWNAFNKASMNYLYMGADVDHVDVALNRVISTYKYQ